MKKLINVLETQKEKKTNVVQTLKNINISRVDPKHRHCVKIRSSQKYLDIPYDTCCLMILNLC
jgi:hypothetical protein